MKIIRKTIKNDELYLKQISKRVSFKNKDYKKDVEQLELFCLENECFALAAVQIGIPKRIIYLKNTSLDIPIENKDYNEAMVLINPIVLSKKGLTKYWEACLSCLDNMGLVIRPYKITVKYQDISGKRHNKTFCGFKATVLAHELDHLDGILHMDIAKKIINMTKEKRKAFRKEHPYEIISKNCDFNR